MRVIGGAEKEQARSRALRQARKRCIGVDGLVCLCLLPALRSCYLIGLLLLIAPNFVTCGVAQRPDPGFMGQLLPYLT